MKTASYGAWESPISIDMITAGSIGLGGGTCDGDVLYWTEARADQGGRESIWRQLPDGTRTELTPDHYVRTMVHEYGGGEWAVRDGVVVFSTFPSHQCFVLSDGVLRELTPGDGKLRYADFQVHPELNLVLAVREDHRESDLDCRNELVALQLDSDNADGGMVIATGADFYSSPRLSAAGDLAWVEWDHPNMPWDVTRLMVGVYRNGVIQDSSILAGGATSAPCYPAWRGSELIFLDDPDGFWNFYAASRGEVRRLHEDAHDYCNPAWVFGGAYMIADDGRIVATRLIDGKMELGILSDDGFTPLGLPGVAFVPGGAGSCFVSTVVYPNQPTQLECWDLRTDEWTVLRRSTEITLTPEWISVPQPVSWEGPQGSVHAWYYPPMNPEFQAPEGELPPLKVLTHGGPTALSFPSLALARQYWTSRGWAIIDVNYGGSSGYGRAYRERLQGQWGVVDVRDCCDAARAMVAQGKADPAKLAIEGASAGGFTTLAALTTSDVFTAGNCLFGLAELQVFCDDTHKFESRYIEGLIGGTPKEKPELFAQRSPINHLAALTCPMLIQQGEDDRIVPPNQAILMADALRTNGLPVALLMFPGEGHGWRRAETIRESIESALSFFGQIFGYEPAGVAPIRIDNLT